MILSNRKGWKNYDSSKGHSFIVVSKAATFIKSTLVVYFGDTYRSVSKWLCCWPWEIYTKLK